MTRSPSATPDFERGAIAFDADQLDLAHFDRLVVLGDEDERALLPALDGHGRDHHRVGPDIEIDLDVDVHPRPQLEACRWRNCALAAMVPDEESTLLSTKSSTPVARAASLDARRVDAHGRRRAKRRTPCAERPDRAPPA